MCGRILKCIGGLYYIAADNAICKARARGIFRKDSFVPLPGDYVEIVQNVNDEFYTITKVYPRKNSFIRPAVANVDIFCIVFAAAEPAPDIRLIDKISVITYKKGVDIVFCINKIDLGSVDELINIYSSTGLPVFAVQGNMFGSCESLRSIFADGKMAVFCGVSGAGKSTITNNLLNGDVMETGELSKKLKRGKNTTRHTELLPFHGGYLADTSGFSAMDLLKTEPMLKEELPGCFPEFVKALSDDSCRFSDCTHISENDCAVKRAVSAGKISESRYQSYCALYDELKRLKGWELKNI